MTSWLPSLMTDTPEAGYDLAVKLSRYAVKLTQPDSYRPAPSASR